MKAANMQPANMQPANMQAGTWPQLLAHQVELSGEVGATLHIEPNDNPRAGEPAVTWFALVTEGGRPIPLSACDCALAIYTLPRQPGDMPVSEPSLSPLSAEGYQAIPSAEITFPAVGEYELLLTGSATGDPDFEPFELSFEVLVARGTNTPTPQTTAESAPAAPTAESATAAPSAPAAAPVDSVEGGWPMSTVLGGLVILGAAIGSVAYLTLRKRLNG